MMLYPTKLSAKGQDRLTKTCDVLEALDIGLYLDADAIAREVINNCEGMASEDDIWEHREEASKIYDDVEHTKYNKVRGSMSRETMHKTEQKYRAAEVIFVFNEDDFEWEEDDE